MDAYYQDQLQTGAFAGPGRQMGSGLGALAMRVGRMSLPLLQKYVLPVAKTVGRELLQQAVPELIEVATKKKPVKRAAADAFRKTAKSTISANKPRQKPKQVIRAPTSAKRRRIDFFKNVNVSNDAGKQ